MKSPQSSIVVFAFILALAYCRSSTSPPSRLREGNWGGNHVGVLVEATQVSLSRRDFLGGALRRVDRDRVLSA